MALAPNSELGPYRLERVLGQGGMGVVYAAYDRRLNRRVAIKRVPADDDHPHRRARLRREARLAAQLAHPAVVQIFDLVERDDADWIVMESVEGQTLRAWIDDGPLDMDDVLAVGRQVAEGLAAAHEKGIIHRDLKSENVMVLPGGDAKILDFGLAKSLDAFTDDETRSALSIPGQVLGTARTMSPEQSRGLEVGPRSDLFSFGVLLYEAATGVSPFRGDSLSDTLVRVATHQPPPLDELAAGAPRELVELVASLLQKAPELRPASAREVADILGWLDDARRFSARRRSGHPMAPGASDDTTVDRDISVSDGTTGPDGPIDAAAPAGAEPAGAAPERRIGTILVAALVLGAVVVALGFLVDPLERLGDSDRVEVLDPAQGATDTGAAPDDPLALYDEGMRAVRRTDQRTSIERAIDIFQRLLEQDPSSAAAYAGLARGYWERARNQVSGGDPIFLEQAAAAAGEAVELDPYLADGWISHGLVALSRGDAEAARESLQRARGLDPTHADVHFAWAQLEERANRLDHAVDHYRQALERRPTSNVHDALGRLFYARGRYGDAETQFQASLGLAPDNAYALRNLGAVHYAQGRLDEAASEFQRALRIRPDASLYSNLGTLFFSQGLYAKAAAAFEDALRMDGASHKSIFWLNLADTYRQMPGKEGDMRTTYRRAVQLLDTEIEASPGDVRLSSRRALALARVGDCDGALEGLQGLAVGSDVYSLFRVAVVEELCGQRDRSLRWVERALDAGLALAEVEREPDLLALRADPNYHHLVMDRP